MDGSVQAATSCSLVLVESLQGGSQGLCRGRLTAVGHRRPQLRIVSAPGRDLLDHIAAQCICCSLYSSTAEQRPAQVTHEPQDWQLQLGLTRTGSIDTSSTAIASAEGDDEEQWTLSLPCAGVCTAFRRPSATIVTNLLDACHNTNSKAVPTQ